MGNRRMLGIREVYLARTYVRYLGSQVLCLEQLKEKTCLALPSWKQFGEGASHDPIIIVAGTTSSSLT